MKTDLGLNLEMMCDVWKNVIHTFDHSSKENLASSVIGSSLLNNDQIL
jgi:hypothetical protein